MSAPFNGAWDFPAWPTEPVSFSQRGVRLLDKGHKHYMVAARIEPEGDLKAFMEAFSKAAKMDPPAGLPDGKRSVAVILQGVYKSPQSAQLDCAFRVRRILRKTRLPVARLSYDVVEVEK